MSNISRIQNKLEYKRKNMRIDADFAKVQPDELRPLVQVVNSRGWCGGLFAALAIVAVIVKLVLS